MLIVLPVLGAHSYVGATGEIGFRCKEHGRLRWVLCVNDVVALEHFSIFQTPAASQGCLHQLEIATIHHVLRTVAPLDCEVDRVPGGLHNIDLGTDRKIVLIGILERHLQRTLAIHNVVILLSHAACFTMTQQNNVFH